ncbi:uncharacterized protein LOC141601635 [Silene latifolia]|uniref:uncharacterized protein LOC141601635 n=1 Tax=Silene latifolia TaxID=37657 RepID=UPI003D7828A6
MCAARLASWARERFGDVKKRIREKEADLEHWERQPPSADMLSRCRDIVKEVDELRRKVETYWYTRARKYELRDGDKNTNYFHHKAKQRKKRNTIVGIENDNGGSCTNEADISKVVISDDINQALDSPIIDEEVKAALFGKHPNKASGSDGMHAFSPKKIMEYCPISLCNVVYKRISKILANRLKPFLNGFISENQSAFTPGRIITDNALVAIEIFHAMKRSGEGRNKSIALKHDMSKAYDWVMTCVATVAHSFLINEKVSCVVTPSRGSCLGDPISPYLFLLCGDVFSYLIKDAVDKGKLHGLRVCRGAPRISHLFFADDSILIARANMRECSTVAKIISTYERASGQKNNYSKSEVVFSKKGIIEELHMLMAKFWWGTTKGKRKIQGWRWDKLCRPKARGGMGFRDLRVFNQALLAKQVWRLMTNLESLAGRLIKARWRVGNGESIKVWEDHWLLGERGSRVPLPNVEADPSIRVAALIDVVTGLWRGEMLSLLLSEAEIDLVHEILLSKRMSADQLFRWPSRSGEYTVKSGYWLGMGLSLPGDGQSDTGAGEGLWTGIWGLKVPPSSFTLYGGHAHECLRCQWRRSFWAASDFDEILEEAPGTSFSKWVMWALHKMVGEEKQRCGALIWAFWTIKNSRIFVEEQCNSEVLIMGFARLVAVYQRNASTGLIRASNGVGEDVGRNAWVPPEQGTIKNNSDAAILGDTDVGFEYRDDELEFKLDSNEINYLGF